MNREHFGRFSRDPKEFAETVRTYMNQERTRKVFRSLGHEEIKVADTQPPLEPQEPEGFLPSEQRTRKAGSTAVAAVLSVLKAG